jgi:hypothetical protein
MHLRWEVYGVIGVITIQTVFVWLTYCMASGLCQIYFLKVP